MNAEKLADLRESGKSLVSQNFLNGESNDELVELNGALMCLEEDDIEKC